MPRFILKLWRDWARKWIEIEIECPRLQSISQYSQCIVSKLADNYEEKMYKYCVERGGDPQVCRIVARVYRKRYEERLEPEIEMMLETEVPRKLARERIRKLSFIGEDMIAKLQQRNIALARLAECMKKHGKKCRMGISSDRLFMLETDSRKKDALLELIEVARALSRYGVRFIIYATRRGFHLLAIDPMRRDNIRLALDFVKEMIRQGKLKYVDPIYVAMVESRGYFTLSVGARRDIHYMVVPIESRVVLLYSPFAMYRNSVVKWALTRFDEIYPIEKYELFRAIREEYVKLEVLTSHG